jgi:histidine kinase/DNA gyrase B/HSP90-like ATPase
VIPIVPDTNLLDSIRNQNLFRPYLLFELLDNSLDAGARRVSIEIDPGGIEVVDDGAGCADLSKMFTMGGRQQHATTKVGWYGIGFKDAVISLGEVTRVTSVHDGIARRVVCDWKRLQASGVWEIEDPEVYTTDAPNGTQVRIERLLRSGRLSPSQTQGLRARLSLHYLPALEEGKQILLRTKRRDQGVTIPAYQMPVLEHAVQAEVEAHGHRARFVVGLVPPGVPCEDRGFFVSYGFRVVEKGSMVGLGDEAVPGVLGRLTLLGRWELTKNKEKVHGLETLAEVMEAHCAPLVELARDRARTILLTGAVKGVNDLLRAVFLQHGKARRPGPHVKVGSVPATGTGSRHRQASTVSGLGGTRGPRRLGLGLQVGFDHYGRQGPAQKYMNGVIYLNEDLSWIQRLLYDEEQLRNYVIPLAATHMVLEHPDQIQLDFMDAADRAEDRIARLTTYLFGCLEQGDGGRTRAAEDSGL